MRIAATQIIFPSVESGELDTIGRLLDDDPGLVHVRHADPQFYDWTPLQLAAAKGHLAACRLLVDRGAEVYTNPMNTYPPVIQAAWNKHMEVVKYFLEEIPDRAAGTNGLGIAINLAAREGWIEIVRKHIERDPLSVHQRGWIGDFRSIGHPITITRRSCRCCWTPGRTSKLMRSIATAVSRSTGQASTRRQRFACCWIAERT